MRGGNNTSVSDLCEVHPASREQGRAWYVRFSARLTGKGIALQDVAWGCALLMKEGTGTHATTGSSAAWRVAGAAPAVAVGVFAIAPAWSAVCVGHWCWSRQEGPRPRAGGPARRPHAFLLRRCGRCPGSACSALSPILALPQLLIREYSRNRYIGQQGRALAKDRGAVVASPTTSRAAQLP
jgi:hypothetical protein